MAPSSAELPPLPGLEEDDVHAIMDIAARTHDEDERWEHALGDRARLACLGRAVLETIATELMFLLRPLPSAEEMIVLRKDVLSDLNISMWMKLYRSSADNVLSSILGGQSPQELITIFEAYVGAVHARFEMDGARTWVSELLYPYMFNQI